MVVDDGSEDATADVAHRYGATVVEAGCLPEGWRGKAWACHRGAECASGEAFLFLDADTWFQPGGLGRIVGEYPQAGCPGFVVGPLA